MRADRLIALTLLLHERGRVTAPAIAGEFGVSVRTVYRDIDMLDSIGVPVIVDRGPAGGYRLMEGYQPHLTGLLRNEAEALFLAGIPGPAGELGFGGELVSAQRKVLATLTPEARKRAEAIRDWIHLDAPGWFLRSEELPQLRPVAGALWEGRSLQVLYQRWSSREPPVERRIDPLGLVLKSGTWYLGGRVEDQVRFYRVSRLLAIDVLDTGFERPAGFDLATAWRNWMDRFEQNLYPIEATVRLNAEGLARVGVMLAPVAARRVEDTLGVPGADGWCRARMAIESIEHGIADALRIGRGVEVIGPPEFRSAIADTARVIAARHAKLDGEGVVTDSAGAMGSSPSPLPGQ